MNTLASVFLDPRGSLRRALATLGAGLLLALVVLVVAAGGLMVNLRQWLAGRDAVERMNAAIVQAEMLMSSVKDAESGQRGYLLTADPDYLEPWRQAVPRLERQLAELRLQFDPAGGDPRLGRIERLLRERLELLAATIALVRVGERGAAIDLLRSERGKAGIETLRAEVEALQRDAQASLAVERTRDRWFTLLLPAAAVLASLIACVQLIGAELERRRREREARSLLDAVLANSPAGVCLLDRDLRIRQINPALAAIHGRTAPEHIGRSLWDYTAPGVRAQIEPLLRKVLAEGRVFSDVETSLEAPGEPPRLRHLLASYFPLRGDAGRIVGVGGIVRDITERKRAEGELAAAKRAAEEANQAKSVFLANMSHELRTPLTAVLGYGEMLEEQVSELGPEARETLEDIRKITANARHLLSLINDVLDLSKIEAGRMEVHAETFDVAALLAEVTGTAEALAARNGNSLEVRAAPDLGTMHSDVVKVRQCLFNLLSNAAKFTEHGRIVLTAERFGPGAAGRLVFRVTDTGIGMTPEELSRIFRRFSQADSSTTRRFGGTGLGLAITRAFCDMLGGEIRVASRAGEGTTVTLELPAQMRTATGEADDGAPREARGGEDAQTALVIDDDADARTLLVRFLTREGLSVSTASDGESGLALARSLRPAVILLDVMLPHLDGWSVLSQLKADPELAAIPVIVISIVNEQGLGYSLGAADYLTKPIDWGHLRQALDRHRYRAASPVAPKSESAHA